MDEQRPLDVVTTRNLNELQDLPAIHFAMIFITTPSLLVESRQMSLMYR